MSIEQREAAREKNKPHVMATGTSEYGGASAQHPSKMPKVKALASEYDGSDLTGYQQLETLINN